jgi:hypothetical protein
VLSSSQVTKADCVVGIERRHSDEPRAKVLIVKTLKGAQETHFVFKWVGRKREEKQGHSYEEQAA